jgi:hypothetical protein
MLSRITRWFVVLAWLIGGLLLATSVAEGRISSEIALAIVGIAIVLSIAKRVF